LILVADPHADYKAIKESSYVNVPIVALCDSHHSLKYVDIAIPCNTSSTDSVSLVFWMLAREINVLKEKLNKDDDEWSTNKSAMFDLFINKDISRFYKVSRVA
jgi:small subunit ribosomal protein SAe